MQNISIVCDPHCAGAHALLIIIIIMMLPAILQQPSACVVCWQSHGMTSLHAGGAPTRGFVADTGAGTTGSTVNRCGTSYSAASTKCDLCPGGIDGECPAGETCFAGLPACNGAARNAPVAPAAPAGGGAGAENRCGTSFSAAASKCNKCPKGIDSECAAGETCFAQVPACTASSSGAGASGGASGGAGVENRCGTSYSAAAAK